MIVGLSKVVINTPLIPVAMKGYGDWKNRVKGKKTDLHARCLYLKHEDQALFFVNVEILMISPSLKRQVLADINHQYPQIPLTDTNLMLTSQHTHSAPSGYSEYAFHTFTTPAISTEIFEAYKKAIAQAIVDAFNNAFEGKLRYVSGDFEDDVPVAWNRSIVPYNKNPEVTHTPEDKAHIAIDRKMRMLVVKDMDNQIKGSVNWFGVHATCVGPKNQYISFDNKGYAADFLENELKDTVHLFAQGKSGDVSPHYHGPGQLAKRKEVAKKGDHLYAKENGKLQFEKAKALVKEEGEDVSLSLDAHLLYVDFTNVEVDVAHTIDGQPHTTGDACVGAAMFRGTPVDGPGISKIEASLFIGINNLVNKKAKDLKEVHGNKDIILNASTREFLGQGKLNVFPNFIDPQIKAANKMAKIGSVDEHTLIPTVLPIQLFIIGELAIAAIPAEITTTAGKRLEQSLLKTFGTKVKEVIICNYANSYVGYITTTEEYDCQHYEGGHTIFGRHALGAFQTIFDRVGNEMKLDKNERSPSGVEKVPIFSKDQLALRTDWELPKV